MEAKLAPLPHRDPISVFAGMGMGAALVLQQGTIACDKANWSWLWRWGAPWRFYWLPDAIGGWLAGG
jgi:hypothetical protein